MRFKLERKLKRIFNKKFKDKGILLEKDHELSKVWREGLELRYWWEKSFGVSKEQFADETIVVQDDLWS